MISPRSRFNELDRRITGWMAGFGLALLRVSVGFIFVWFGLLKFFPGLSPAQDLAIRTIDLLSFSLVPPRAAIVLLAVWETLIGLGLLFRLQLRATLFLLFAQMLGTMTPLFFFPAETFTWTPFAPTLEGQYIIKNLVLISAGIVLGATVRGGGLRATTSRNTRAQSSHE